MKNLLNLSKINGSLKSFKSSIFGAKKTTSNMKIGIFRKTKVKKQTIQGKKNFWRKKKEYDRRQENESLLEAKEIVVNPIKSIARSTGGFLSRILSFLGTLLVGWLMNNLPTIIAMAQELIARIQRMFALLQGFIGNIFNIVKNFGQVLGSIFQNIISLDIFDTSNRVKKSLNELETTFSDMGKQLDEGIKLATTSLDQSIAPGGPGSIPPAGTDYTTPPGERSEGDETTGAPGGNGGTRATYGTPRERALLDAIATGEGTSGPNGYRTMFGGGTFDTSKGWKHPDRVIRSGGYASSAAGRYQFLTPTWQTAANALGLTDFSPVNQDKAALWLVKRRGVTDALLSKEGLSAKVSNLLSGEWASFPTLSGSSAYGQPVAKLKVLQQAYQKSLGSPVSQEDKPGVQGAPQAPLSTNFAAVSGTSGDSQGRRPLSVPYSPFKPGANTVITSGKGMRWGRPHNGYDISAPSGTPMYAYFPGKVTHTGLAGSSSDGGYGNWAVWKDDIYGAYHFFGHMRDSPAVRVGQVINQGTLIGLVGSTGRSTGPHLHWEISNNPPASNGQFSSYEDPGSWLKTHPLKKVEGQNQQTQTKPTPAPITPAPKTTAPVSTTQATPTTTATPTAPSITPTPSSAPVAPAAQVSSPQLSQQLAQTIQTSTTPQQQTVFIDDVQQPQPIMSPSGGGNMPPPMTMSSLTLLNRFMKHHILLDLAYT